jgi:lactate racemase
LGKARLLDRAAIAWIMKQCAATIPTTPSPQISPMSILKYGAGSAVRVELSGGVQPQESATPRGSALSDLGAAVAEALEQPLDYPPLRQSTTPGDRIVLALGQGLPRAAEITAAVIHGLVAAGVGADGISVLRTEADVDTRMPDPCSLLEGALAERVRLMTHDAENRQSLAYLAASASGEPIFLNRLLTDADLVLPIGCLEASRAAGYFGVHSPIFPAFSDLKTQARFRRTAGESPDHASGPWHCRELTEEANHVAWLLGINFTVQLVPAGGDDVLHVLAGQGDGVRRRGRELYKQAWTYPAARRASMVVAAIEGSASQQTWEKLGRAVQTASRLAEEGGAIAVCCDLAAAPGPAVQSMQGARSRRTAMRKFISRNLVDLLPAMQLAHALDRHRVYLLSRLDPALVEELDMVPVGGPEELARLARRHASCILLANAQHAIATVENE